ncbi:MAG: Do family serine endopeptidase [Spirochaetia bacterium]|jgi:serine protease Do|nr:Do family serine endopeptidase [Spirochaetia bacterium]
MINNKKTKGILILFTVLFLLLFSQCIFSSPSKEAEKPLQSSADAPQMGGRIAPDSADQVFYSFSGVAQKVLPVVVEINTVEVVEQTIPNFSNPFDFFFRNQPNQPGQQNPPGQKREYSRPGLGSGVIVKHDGKKVYVLTNNHVAGNANEIKVKLNDGREFDAKIIGNDPRTDLALIMFETSEKVPVAVLGNSDDLFVGDIVLAVGNPFGFESTVTMGIISALGRKSMANSQISGFTDYIQTDASINPGNSGGALVNMKGEIVGINTWIASQSGGSVGVGFAIPINNSKKAIEDFISTGSVVYGWLGVSIGDLSDPSSDDMRKSLGLESKKGAIVFNLFKKSPADKSGLMPGDFITEVDNVKIDSSSHLTQIVGRLSPGQTSVFKLVRDKKEITVNVKIEKRADESEIQKNRDLWPGLIVTTLSDDIRKELKTESSVKGVVIVSVIEDSSAAIAGIKPGDIIEEINEIPVTDIGSFYSVLNKQGSSRKIFQINRQGSSIMIGLLK